MSFLQLCSKQGRRNGSTLYCTVGIYGTALQVLCRAYNCSVLNVQCSTYCTMLYVQNCMQCAVCMYCDVCTGQFVHCKEQNVYRTVQYVLHNMYCAVGVYCTMHYVHTVLQVYMDWFEKRSLQFACYGEYFPHFELHIRFKTYFIKLILR